MNFLIGLSDSYKNTEKLWIIIAAVLVVLSIGAIIIEVIRRKIPTKYLKFNSCIFTIFSGCTAFIYPLIFEWWLAILIVFATIPFIKSIQKTDLIMFSRNILKIERGNYDYSPHLIRNIYLIITCSICYLCGFFVFYAVCVL